MTEGEPDGAEYDKHGDSWELKGTTDGAAWRRASENDDARGGKPEYSYS